MRKLNQRSNFDTGGRGTGVEIVSNHLLITVANLLAIIRVP
jgi:hypothetical protein